MYSAEVEGVVPCLEEQSFQGFLLKAKDVLVVGNTSHYAALQLHKVTLQSRLSCTIPSGLKTCMV